MSLSSVPLPIPIPAAAVAAALPALAARVPRPGVPVALADAMVFGGSSLAMILAESDWAGLTALVTAIAGVIMKFRDNDVKALRRQVARLAHDVARLHEGDGEGDDRTDDPCPQTQTRTHTHHHPTRAEKPGGPPTTPAEPGPYPAPTPPPGTADPTPNPTDPSGAEASSP